MDQHIVRYDTSPGEKGRDLRWNWISAGRTFPRIVTLGKLFMVDFADGEFVRMKLLHNLDLLVTIETWDNKYVQLSFSEAICIKSQLLGGISEVVESKEAHPLKDAALAADFSDRAVGEEAFNVYPL